MLMLESQPLLHFYRRQVAGYFSDVNLLITIAMLSMLDLLVNEIWEISLDIFTS